MGSVGEKWVSNITGEKNEIAAYALGASDTGEHLREMIVGARRLHENSGEPLSDVVYVAEN